MQARKHCTCVLPEERHIVWIPAKQRNVSPDPVKREALILETDIGRVGRA
jgi:hypothetical protein